MNKNSNAKETKETSINIYKETMSVIFIEENVMSSLKSNKLETKQYITHPGIT